MKHIFLKVIDSLFFRVIYTEILYKNLIKNLEMYATFKAKRIIYIFPKINYIINNLMLKIIIICNLCTLHAMYTMYNLCSHANDYWYET